MAVGTERIRERKDRPGERRVWVKVAEPNVWKLRAHVVWEAAHGPVPRGRIVHHRDENKMNDALGNLAMLTKAEHLAEHVPEYRDRITANLVRERRTRRWTTKSATKRTGAPPKYDAAALADAGAAISRGMSPNAAAIRFGVSRTTCYRLRDRAK